MTTPRSSPSFFASGHRGRSLSFVAALVASLFTTGLLAQAPAAAPTGATAPVPGEELEKLVGRIALYPDDLVAVILPASTNPLQLVQADRFLDKRKADPKLPIDDKWDDAVKTLLNYPDIVKMMSADLDWTSALGEAVVADQGDVLEAVQTFRRKAQSAGNLKSDDKQVVKTEKEIIIIEPADPQVIYVPQYNPTTVVTVGVSPYYYGYYPTPYPSYYYPYAPGAAFAAGVIWGAAIGAAWNGGHYGANYGGNANININHNTNINTGNIGGGGRTKDRRAAAAAVRGNPTSSPARSAVRSARPTRAHAQGTPAAAVGLVPAAVVHALRQVRRAAVWAAAAPAVAPARRRERQEAAAVAVAVAAPVPAPTGPAVRAAVPSAAPVPRGVRRLRTARAAPAAVRAAAAARREVAVAAVVGANGRNHAMRPIHTIQRESINVNILRLWSLLQRLVLPLALAAPLAAMSAPQETYETPEAAVDSTDGRAQDRHRRGPDPDLRRGAQGSGHQRRSRGE